MAILRMLVTCRQTGVFETPLSAFIAGCGVLTARRVKDITFRHGVLRMVILGMGQNCSKMP
jgi:hypothetical protein